MKKLLGHMVAFFIMNTAVMAHCNSFDLVVKLQAIPGMSTLVTLHSAGGQTDNQSAVADNDGTATVTFSNLTAGGYVSASYSMGNRSCEGRSSFNLCQDLIVVSIPRC